MITLTVVGSMLMFQKLLDVSVQQIQEKVDINVYMHTKASEEAIKDLEQALKAFPDVKEVTYTSKEEALALFQERHKHEDVTMQALAELDENPLGATLSIRAKDPEHYESIAAFLEQRREAESPDAPLIGSMNFNRNKESIEKLTRIIHQVERASYITMIVLVAASILISFNTIRLAIYTAREEISVMRLVGASNMFIRGPFVLQGIMYGLVAGILTLLFLYPAVLWIGPNTESFFNFNIFEDYFVQEFGRLFILLVGSGIVLGTVSSTLAIARYLRI